MPLLGGCLPAPQCSLHGGGAHTMFFSTATTPLFHTTVTLNTKHVVRSFFGFFEGFGFWGLISYRYIRSAKYNAVLVNFVESFSHIHT